MPDGLRIDSKGSDEAAARLLERAARARDLAPVMRVVAAEIDRETDTAFRSSTSPFGEPFPRLAPSTAAARAAKLPGANRRSKKSGQLTAGARRKRTEAAASYAAGAPKIFTPLIDTGRARGSAHATADATGVSWTAVGYLGPHIMGSKSPPGRPPKRNVSVFQMQGGVLRPIPRIQSLLLSGVARYVSTGRVS